MDRATWDRRAPFAGACFAVLAAICYFLLPTAMPPKASDGGDKYVSYISMHHTALLWHGYLTGIAFVFFVWFVAAVAHRLEGLGESRLAATMYAGGLIVAGIALLQASIMTWLAWDHGGGLDGSMVKALINVPAFAFAFPWAVFVGASAIASWRAKMLPEYLNMFGVLLAVWILVSGATFAHSGFFSPGGWFGGIAVIAFLVGTFVASCWLTLHPEGMPAHEPRMAHHSQAMHL